MTASSPPDWAALYLQYRDAMYRVAARTLGEAGRAADADDVVMAAMESLMRNPPEGVANWEAMMVRASKMRALDLLGSAAVRHAASKPPAQDEAALATAVDDDVIEAIDRERAAAAVLQKLVILDQRHRKVAWDYLANKRPRAEVAAELGVSGGRVSQMAISVVRQLREALAREGVEP